MTDFVFLKGDDVTVKLNSEILGGVLKAECVTQNTFINIEQFLTDIPVKRISKKNYEIVLTQNSDSENPLFQSDSIAELEFSDNQRTVKYYDCCVKSTESIINAKGAVEYKVKIIAGKREVVLL